MSDKIEFYKSRSISERVSVAVDFLKQNWKVLYKNILIGGIPLAIILGYFMVKQTNIEPISDLFIFFLYYSLLIIVSFVNFVYVYSMTGSVLLHYEQNQLTETTGWNDSKDNFFKLAGKTTLISLIIYIPIIVIAAIVFGIFGISVAASSSSGMVGSILLLIFFIIVLLGGFIAVAPSITMLYFPAYFSGKTNMESIKIAFSLGFKNWGSLFVAIILTGIVFSVIYMIFTAPFQILTLFSLGEINIISFILATLSALGTFLVYPVMTTIFAFQYFSIVEKEEGVSLQSQVSEFENL